jgi:hypothetical protein
MPRDCGFLVSVLVDCVLLQRAASEEDGAPVFDNFFHYILGGFQHQKLLASSQSYDGVRRNFDMFDEIGVND